MAKGKGKGKRKGERKGCRQEVGLGLRGKQREVPANKAI